MRKALATVGVLTTLAVVSAASAQIPPIPSSCLANPYQQVCEFVTGRFVKTQWRCVRLWVPGGPYACRSVRPVI